MSSAVPPWTYPAVVNYKDAKQLRSRADLRRTRDKKTLPSVGARFEKRDSYGEDDDGAPQGPHEQCYHLGRDARIPGLANFGVRMPLFIDDGRAPRRRSR